MTIKKAASVLQTHPTRITGLLLVIVGSLQANSEVFRSLLSPTQYGLFTIGTGVVVAALGFLNAGRAKNGVAGDDQT